MRTRQGPCAERTVKAVDVRFTLKPEDELTDEQIREIEASREMPFVQDEDSPLLDPDTTPELWANALKALGDRNRRMAQRMA